MAKSHFIAHWVLCGDLFHNSEKWPLSLLTRGSRGFLSSNNSVMDDKGHLKAPPDLSPTKALGPENDKNKIQKGKHTPSTLKHSSVCEANMAKGKQEPASPMEPDSEHHGDMHSKSSDFAHKIVAISEQVDLSLTLHDSSSCKETMEKNQSNNTPSFRGSLLGLGFNRVAKNGADTTEEDDFLSDLINKSWDLPQPSEEIKKLMNIYPVVHIEQDEYDEMCRPWNTALIITILGKTFNSYQLKEQLRCIWGIPEFEIISLGNNYFSIRFNTDTENWAVHYKKVLFGGPWVVSQHCVIVQMWSPYFDPFQNPLSRMVTWVRVPDVPLYCYNKNFMSRLGNMIGKTLKIELNPLTDYSGPMTRVGRGKFARICVELDLQKELVPGFIAANEIINVEYEGLGLVCFACGRYGHHKENCP